jgi:RNA polymerase sigma factor (sigma-70 family)
MNLEQNTLSPETHNPRVVPVSPEVQRTVEAAFRHYESRLFHAALRITHNEDDAWDAVQEGMVSALRNAERFRGDAAVASWLYSIVVNAALYQRRRAAARRRGVDKYDRARVARGRALPRGRLHPPRPRDLRARPGRAQRVPTLIDALPPTSAPSWRRASTATRAARSPRAGGPAPRGGQEQAVAHPRRAARGLPRRSRGLTRRAVATATTPGRSRCRASRRRPDASTPSTRTTIP